ncbi:MAG: TonB-dependent receptor [Kangiella sp.]|nr:MAG: TonB-dependent receptor [Kangiella sp.]
MNKPMKKSKVSIAIASAFIAIFGTSTVFAENASTDEEENKIIVIGSHIKRATDIGALPVTDISAEDILNLGVATGDELLRSIPQIGGIAFGAATGNGGVNDARGDVSSINLRGVGTGNTLTLLNGRRLVTHPGTQSENFVPVSTVNSNTLPVAGLRSLQVLRDGAAAIYGADAVAGVVNYVLNSDYDGSKVSFKYGGSEGTPLDETTFTYLTGFDFNDKKSHITASFSYYDRNGMMASERAYSASHDLREFPGLPADFVGDTQLDNRSTSTPWGEFQSDALGRFHLQPDTQSGCVVDLGDGICADGGSFPRENRFDRGTTRSLVSDVNRLNFYAYLNHDFGNGMELFGETVLYRAKAERTREQTHNLTAQRFQISATAAHNPFGEQVLLRRYRALDAGPRNVEVVDTSYRILAGVRDNFGQWDWESAFLYTGAQTKDVANRIQASAFQASINSTDPSVAYDVFTGGDINNPNSGDSSLNPQNIIDSFVVDVHRDSKTTLAQVDFSLNNSALFSNWAGDAGAAFGVEFRRETFEDDRDALLDGSNPFIDQITGLELSGSDVLGSSPTPDSSGSRTISSAYAELVIPLIDSGSQYMEVQVAARIENFSDIGSSGVKPKIALFYEPLEWVSLRASYSQGFRAPGLPQVTAEGVPRSNNVYDPVLDDSYGIVDVRSGSTDLEPEDVVNTSYGVVFKPLDDLTITIDSWKIEQENVVGILPGSTHLLYDAYLRARGSTNTAVIRDATTNEVIRINNNYLNLDIRNIEGIDFSVAYDLETSFGDWGLTLNAAKLQKFDQEADSISALLIADGTNIVSAGDLIKQNGRPELRARAALNWKFNQWGAGVSKNYVSEVTDTSTYYDDDDDVRHYLPVDSFSSTNVYASYNFENDNFLKGSRVRIGVRNIGDKQPPLADELAHGYFGALHSNRGRYFYLSFSKKL